jgi:rare lipoprotein A (peptidoglycan hydrolase)
MLTIAKKPLSSAALLCAVALSACAVAAAPAIAAEGTATATTTGATAAPGEAPTSAPSESGPRLQEGLGLATWFGPGLFGRHTACGQLLTKQLVGVANRSLPCGTLVDFSYRGHQLTVPVVDRGPYSSIGANWDLTEGAAHLLKMGGTARLEAKIVGHVENSPELGQQPTGHSSSRTHKATAPATGPSGGVEAG